MIRKVSALSLLLVVALGCGSKESSVPTLEKGGKTRTEAVAPTVNAALRHEGFSYYGLENPKPIKMRLDQGDGKGFVEGVTTISKEKSDNPDEEIFLATRTGGLERLGSDTIKVSKDGIMMVGSSVIQFSKPTMELPANVEPGKTWSESTDITIGNGTKGSLKSTYKIVGVEKVKVGAKEYEALVVSNVGSYSIGGAKSPVEAKAWYVKGVGLVRQKSVVTQSGQKITSTIEIVN
ncbi:MAG: hypothetical protein K8R88_12430 [Armatimonadetes bacterium]|nr:hypothetical protein [Armatimonadota bacterium]